MSLPFAGFSGGVFGVPKGIRTPDDPVGRVLDGRTLKNGLQIEKVTVPMGCHCSDVYRTSRGAYFDIQPY